MAESERHYPIRRAEQSDAEAISEVVVQTLRLSNSQDYSAEVIERVAGHFDAAGVRQLIATRQVFVLSDGERMIATASLADALVRTVFVLPAAQRRGLGRLLMAHIEQVAREAGIQRLLVPASLTAVSFYAALGYEVIREVVEGDERTQVMARELG